jgi:hypothetical protein
MAIRTGTPGNNHLVGTDAEEIIIGDPYTLTATDFLIG